MCQRACHAVYLSVIGTVKPVKVTHISYVYVAVLCCFSQFNF